MDIITIRNVRKTFGQGPRRTEALNDISLSVEKGSFTAITGPSGSGKTTLLNIIGGLYAPTAGTVIVDGTNPDQLTEDERTIFRRRKIGFVFQDHNLVPELTIRENILFPALLDDSLPDPAFFSEITGLLGLTDQLDAFPHMLSGGGGQRAAIARAFITRPAILLADEPTAKLDAGTSQDVAGLLSLMARTLRQTLILITHNPGIAQLADRTIRLKDGRIADERYKNVP